MVENKLFSNNDPEPIETVLPARIDGGDVLPYRVNVCAIGSLYYTSEELCGEKSMAITVGQ